MNGRLALVLVAFVATMALSWLWPKLDRPPSHHEIGRALLDENRPLEAVLLFGDRMWRGIAEFEAGRYERAVGEFYPPKSTLELYNLGTTLARLEDWNGATSAFERVLRLEPDHTDARHNLEIVARLAALDGSQPAEPPPASSLLRDEGGTENQQPGPQDGKAEEQRSSDGHDNDTPEADSDLEREGNSDRAGELREMGKTQRAGTSDLSGDPGEKTEQTMRDRRGAAELAARESRQATEILLRQIADDPGKVLRVRLYTAHRNRQPEAQ